MRFLFYKRNTVINDLLGKYAVVITTLRFYLCIHFFPQRPNRKVVRVARYWGYWNYPDMLEDRSNHYLALGPILSFVWTWK